MHYHYNVRWREFLFGTALCLRRQAAHEQQMPKQNQKQKRI
ncbi:hypothetical protein TGS27_2245 [Geobacillus stearothermophilus]|uniref:Uncharacterized protein n=1 Tax=Geobacillus stearothermophilus TaxID=1422 RepID=A0A150NCH5_GEOSE|nr:hypothetical protein GS8_2006 [Geobacillus stearothermophilus]KYD19534.1 hypothetical protein B4109_1841 [Geobacillus stearothermophilus]KYD34417.1 hypothetical protein B4114_1922 [Geobacillus stearothermophilus]OAO79075.1 hypothetical protein TGS27_2245 [Geobacillus stearothermophilus]